jgi:glycosyltransferase involved in cell wall biosynthesis
LRIPNLFGIRHIKIGPSFTKIPLDLLLFFKALSQIFCRKYDLVFSHEEAGWFGIFLAAMKKIPHVYDMHSSLPQQLENFRFTRSALVVRIFRWLEERVLKRSRSIIVICPDLLNTVKKLGHQKKTLLLENFIDFEPPEISSAQVAAQRKKFAGKEEKIVLYVGNFQSYQGIPLFLQTASRFTDEKVTFLLVGGKGRELEGMKETAKKLGLGNTVCFTGQVPPSRVPLFIELADALVSPRTEGTNTPLKIYSFLNSGKPLVATRLWTHTQVLDDKVALLVEPDPDSMAQGIRKALFHDEGQVIARAARAHAEKNYTYSRYRRVLSQVLQTALKTGEDG